MKEGNLGFDIVLLLFQTWKTLHIFVMNGGVLMREVLPRNSWICHFLIISPSVEDIVHIRDE